jgi:hypothetical protein
VTQLTDSSTIAWSEPQGAGANAPLLANVKPSGFQTPVSITLLPNSFSTTVPVTGCKPTSTMSYPLPVSRDARGDVGNMDFTMGTDEFTINHASNPLTDRRFTALLTY